MKTISRYLMTLVALFAMTTQALADEATITLKCGTTEKTYENVTLPWSTTADILKAVVTDINFNININAISGGDGKVVKYGNENFTVTGTFSGEATVVVSYNMGSSATITVTAPGSLLTLNEAKTEASFEMPTYDLTVDYELVRDMAVSVSTEISSRIRIQQVESKFVPVVEAEINPAVTDNLDTQNPVAMTVNTDYSLQLQKKEEGETPTWTDVEALSVGTFRYQVTGTGLYDGEIYTNEFQLFEGYEVEVPAGEYVTYYKDEALKVEDEDAQLYTITAVSGTTATAQELNIAPANTPILVKNNSTEKKTILLIPTTEEADNVTVYSGFKGTAEGTTITASADSQDNYAFNGKEFVRVTEALDIAANKAWLKVTATTASAAPQIRLVFNSATGIERVDGGQLTVDGWYDLSGRRLPGKPSQKGVYIVNGKKVVIK